MTEKIVTQIGSLPFSNVEQALSYSLKCDIPFLPELIPFGDGMLEYAKQPGKLSCLKRFKEIAEGLEMVKVQCIGPASLMFARYERKNAIETVRAHISEILKGLKAKQVILFLDEPSLDRHAGDYDELWKPVFDGLDVIRGIHTCGESDFDRLLSADIEIVSFDASTYDITKHFEYGRSRMGGKRIAWGVKKLSDVKDFRRGDLITPPCGIGRVTPEECAPILDNLKKIAGSLPTR